MAMVTAKTLSPQQAERRGWVLDRNWIMQFKPFRPEMERAGNQVGGGGC